MMTIEGDIVYEYSDIFTDTADLREISTGSSALTPQSWQWTEFGGTAYLDYRYMDRSVQKRSEVECDREHVSMAGMSVYFP